MGNARPHNLGRAQNCIKALKAKRLPHLVLAPSDFFLLGYLKGKLSDYNCESREDLLNAITAIFTGVGQEVLLSVFESGTN
jgi:hypothetical protein